MVVVANVDVPVTKAEPETVRPVVEALANVVWPLTVKMLLMVVVPVMAKVLEVELNVKLLEPDVEEAAVAKTTWLAASDPLSLLLKVVQSAANNCPVLEMEANGRFIVREFVVVLMLKIFPAVPVETFVITLLLKEIWVEVPMSTFWPPVMDRPLPTVKLPSVVVPIPPLVTARGLVRVREVKLGVADTAMVEVPDKTMLEPAVSKLPMSENTGCPAPALLRTWNTVPARVERKVEPS